MSHYIIVGRSFKTLRERIIERGDEYTYLQDILTTKFPEKRFKRRVLANFTNKQTILDAVKRLPHRYDGVIANYENYVLPAAWIAEELELPGISVESALACTDKFTMRSLFAKSPEKISPGFAIVNNQNDLERFVSNHSFPLILKPANLAKSLLVTKNSNLDELLANYQKMLGNVEEVYKKYAPHSQPKIIVEEFMTGPIYSVDAFVDHEGVAHVLDQIVDYQTGYDIGYDDNFHYSRLLPSKLDKHSKDRLKRVAALGVKSLGMRSSAAHIEIIMTAEGPQIVEIGARNGGYRERMHGLANGIDIVGAALDLALGKTPSILATRNDPCAVLELFPKNPGNFIELKNEVVLRNLPSLEYLSIKAKTGKFAGKSSDGFKMCAIIILHNSDAKQFQKDLDYVNNNVYVETEAK